MCGLFGAFSLNRGSSISTKLLYKNAEEMDNRGGDSVGWCVAMDNAISYWKRIGYASKHRKELKQSVFGCPSIIGHTRFATHGSETVEDNNHPHLYCNEEVVGAVTHNGVIGSHESIAKTNGVELIGECDSEIIARLIEDSSITIDLPKRIANAVNECSPTDSIALSVLETGDDEVDICLVARGNPVWYSIRNGVLYYASTKRKLPDSPIKLEEGSILHARQHVGILDVFSGLMDSYSQGSLYSNWRTYGNYCSGYSGLVSKKDNTGTRKQLPLLDVDVQFDSFDDWHNGRIGY